MEVAMELEDDLFFADLSKRISLLIMDDDDGEDPVANYPSVSFQDLSRGNYPTAPAPFMYEQSCRRESKGTGVFIPRSSQPRRKHRQGRHSSFNSRSHSHKHHGNSTTVSHQVPVNSSFYPKKG